MKLFGNRECPSCREYENRVEALEEEVKALAERNEKLANALKRLKTLYEEQTPLSEAVSLNDVEISALFGRIRASNHPNDVKRQLRGLLMLIEAHKEACLHAFLLRMLQEGKC